MSLDSNHPLYESGDWARDQFQIWKTLSGSAQETLHGLCKNGPTYDGDVLSKTGRDELLRQKLASKIVVANGEDGYQAATYLGLHVFKAGRFYKG